MAQPPTPLDVSGWSGGGFQEDAFDSASFQDEIAGGAFQANAFQADGFQEVRELGDGAVPAPIERYAQSLAAQGATTVFSPATTLVAGTTAFLFAGGTGKVIASIVDSKGNTWAVDQTAQNGANQAVSVAHAAVTSAVTPADTITITWAVATSQTVQVVVEEVSGIYAVSPADKTATQMGAASPTVTVGPTAALGQAVELVWLVSKTGNTAATLATAAGWQRPATADLQGFSLEYQVTTTNAAVSFSASYSTNVNEAALLATFKAYAYATSTETVGSSPLVRLLAPTVIASAELIGAAKPVRLLAPAGIGTSETVGTATARRLLAPSGITTSESFGAASARRLLAPSGIATAGAVGTATARRLLADTGITSAESFGTDHVARLLADVLIQSAEAVGTDRSVRLVAPHGIATAETFGNATLVVGPAPPAPTTSPPGGHSRPSPFGRGRGWSPPLPPLHKPVVTAPSEPPVVTVPRRTLTAAGIGSSEWWCTPTVTLGRNPRRVAEEEVLLLLLA